MKHILVFVNSFNYGGITSLIQDIYRNLNRNEYRMSFVRLNWNINDFDREVLDNGDKIFYINDEGLNNIPYFNYEIRKRHMAKKICNIVDRSVQYDVAYIHANADYCVYAAKKLNIQNIIMHSHEALADFQGNEKKSKIIGAVWKKRIRMYNKLVNHKLGDSTKACIAKFGESVINDPKMMVLHPPINTEKFNPNNYDKTEITKSFSIDDTVFNMVHVGRLCAVKNQKFLIEVLSEMIKSKDCKLYIIGEGNPDKTQLMDYAKEKGVFDKVVFLQGNTTAGIYTMMDCSLLPSHSEAFGMVAVESQLMGVPCFASTNVPKDVNVGTCEFLELGKGAGHWAKKILDYDYEATRIDNKKVQEFDIAHIVEKLEGIF